MSNQSSADEIAKLHGLLKDGVISQQEFDTIKKRIINEDGQPPTGKKRPTPPPQQKPRSASQVIVICAALLVMIWGLSSLGNTSDTFTVESEVLIMQDANFTASGETCSGVGAFAGVTGGATVTITADNGDQVMTQLADGVLSPEGNCLLAFTVELPESDHYRIDVGEQTQLKSANTIGTYDDGTRWMSVQFD